MQICHPTYAIEFRSLSINIMTQLLSLINSDRSGKKTIVTTIEKGHQNIVNN